MPKTESKDKGSRGPKTPTARTTYRNVDYWVTANFVTREDTVGEFLDRLANKALKG